MHKFVPEMCRRVSRCVPVKFFDDLANVESYKSMGLRFCGTERKISSTQSFSLKALPKESNEMKQILVWFFLFAVLLLPSRNLAANIEIDNQELSNNQEVSGELDVQSVGVDQGGFWRYLVELFRTFTGNSSSRAMLATTVKRTTKATTKPTIKTTTKRTTKITTKTTTKTTTKPKTKATSKRA